MLPVSRSDARLDLTAPPVPAGQLDCRFGVLGRATAEYPHFGGAASESIAYASAMDATGRLLIAGHSFDARGALVASIVRFRANGTVDPGFGIHGFVTLPTSMPGGAAWLRHIAVAPDGRILVAFDVKGEDCRAVRLCRLLPDGAVDTGFLQKGAGAMIFLPESSFDSVRGLAIQPDGCIVLLATSHVTGAQGSVLSLLRLRPDGHPDPTFGGAGAPRGMFDVVPPPGTSRRRPWMLMLAPDGGVVIGGDLVAGADNQQLGLALLRCNDGGEPDVRFGGNSGWLLLENSGNDILRQLLVRDDGAVLVVAQVSGRGTPSMTRCTQITPSGAPDPAFGRCGEVITPLAVQGRCQRPQAACLQADGMLVLVGAPWDMRGGQRVTVTRLLPDGSLDETFGEAGHVRCGFHSEFERGDATSVDSIVGVHPYQDRIVVAGHLLECEMKYKFCTVALQA